MNFLRNILWRVIFGKYDATEWSSQRSWRSAPLQDAKMDLNYSSREMLQAKSRDWERNSPIYAKLADTWEQYTVGIGIQFSAASSDPVWNALADETWEKWKSVADVQGRFGFDNLQGIISRRLFVDGECFVLLTRDNLFPRIQLLEAHRCKTPDNRKQEEGKTICDGVRIDPNSGRVLGYWFQRPDKSFHPEEEANIVHIFEPERPAQYRGVPYCTSSLNVLHDREDLRTLEMRAAKDAADLSTVVYSQSGEMPQGMVSMVQKFRNVSQPAGTASSVTEQRRDYYQAAAGGRTLVAFQNDKIEQHVPERPGGNTREYWRLLDADICAPSGIPLCLVYPDSMQGTVYRGALELAAAHFRCKTQVLATYFRRIRNYVIEAESKLDRKLAKKPEDWRRTSNGSVRSPSVDIGRNSTAILQELAAGTRSFSSIAAELGLDGNRILAEKAEEAEYIRKLAADHNIDPSEISVITINKPNRSPEAVEEMEATAE